jgi:hypothetical protein
MTNAAILDAPSLDGNLHLGDEGFWAHGEVTPPRDDQQRRATDASKLTFPLQLVVVIVAGIVGTTGAFWVATSQLRADIAVIRQSQTDQVKIDEMKAKLDEANRQLLVQTIESVKADVSGVRGLVQLANIDIGNVRREMSERSRK